MPYKPTGRPRGRPRKVKEEGCEYSSAPAGVAEQRESLPVHQEIKPATTATPYKKVIPGVAVPETAIIEALWASKGSISDAARLIGYADRATLAHRIQASDTLKAAVHEYRETRIDRVEVNLQRLADEENNIAALIFLAKTLGRDRGYAEQPAVIAPTQVVIKIQEDWRRPTMEGSAVVIESQSQLPAPSDDD
jgi:hypothetical protein